jgi:hypothetical protein
MGQEKYKVLVEEPEGKITLVRCMHIYEDNIKTGFRIIVFENVDRIKMTWSRDQ